MAHALATDSVSTAPYSDGEDSYHEGELVGTKIDIRCSKCRKINDKILCFRESYEDVNTLTKKYSWVSEFQCHSCGEDNFYVVSDNMFKLLHDK